MEINEFYFAGYGPDQSAGSVILTPSGRIILSENPNNPGTAMINALESAVGAAEEFFSASADLSEYYYWESPADSSIARLWKLTRPSSNQEIEFTSVERLDTDLQSAYSLLESRLAYLPIYR
jgi:hypothetical protein